MFASPLHVGVETVGELTVYQDTVGMLTDEHDADGRELARMLPALMSAVQARAPQPLLAGDLIDAEAHRAEVHQAAGVTAAQYGIDVDEALIRIWVTWRHTSSRADSTSTRSPPRRPALTGAYPMVPRRQR